MNVGCNATMCKEEGLEGLNIDARRPWYKRYKRYKQGQEP